MAFAVNDRWPGFRGSHGLFLLLCPLARRPQSCATATRCRDVFRIVWQRRGQLLRIDVAANPQTGSSSPTALGGYRLWGCQVIEKGPPIGAERWGRPTPTRPPKGARQPSLCMSVGRRLMRSGAGAAFDRAVGAIGVDVERTRGPLDHF